MSKPDINNAEQIDPLDLDPIPPRLTQFIESRVLWVVLAFGAGVLAHDIAQEHRYARELNRAAASAERAIAIAQTYADACGPAALVLDIPADKAHWEGKP